MKYTRTFVQIDTVNYTKPLHSGTRCLERLVYTYIIHAYTRYTYMHKLYMRLYWPRLYSSMYSIQLDPPAPLVTAAHSHTRDMPVASLPRSAGLPGWPQAPGPQSRHRRSQRSGGARRTARQARTPHPTPSTKAPRPTSLAVLSAFKAQPASRARRDAPGTSASSLRSRALRCAGRLARFMRTSYTQPAWPWRRGSPDRIVEGAPRMTSMQRLTTSRSTFAHDSSVPASTDPDRREQGI